MPLRNKFSGKARRTFYHTFTYWQFTKPLVFTKENSEFVTTFTYHHFIFQGRERERTVSWDEVNGITNKFVMPEALTPSGVEVTTSDSGFVRPCSGLRVDLKRCLLTTDCCTVRGKTPLACLQASELHFQGTCFIKAPLFPFFNVYKDNRAQLLDACIRTSEQRRARRVPSPESRLLRVQEVHP